MNRKPIYRLVLCAALASAAALLVGPAAASAAPGPINYVALGSSFASGYGQAPFEASTIGSYCGRSLNDYPRQVSAALNLTLTDVTCGGATTDNILTVSQYGFIPPQINAVTSDTSLVTITAGGNDVNYLLDLDRNSCANDPSAIPAAYQPLVCTPLDTGATAAALKLLQQRLVNVVQAVQALRSARSRRPRRLPHHLAVEQ